MTKEKQNIKKWIKALRSGKYKQARGALRNRDDFCCLGVACDRFHDETGEGEWRKEEFSERREFILPHGSHQASYLPARVQRWLGIKNNGKWLANMNDNGASFEEIADYLEKEYL